MWGRNFLLFPQTVWKVRLYAVLVGYTRRDEKIVFRPGGESTNNATATNCVSLYDLRGKKN